MKESRTSLAVCSLVAACAVLSGCSGDDNTTTTGPATTGTSGSGGSGGSTGTGGSGGAGGSGSAQCTSSILMIFDKAYSAYDGTNVYKIPVIAVGVTSEVKWTASADGFVDIDPDKVDFGDAGVMGKGAMLTTRKAGKVTITAQAGTACGTSELTITDGTPALRQTGNDRYNNGVPVTFDGGRTPACTNCHGPAAQGQLVDVQHSPQQTGGYSDEELIGIFTLGQKPQGGGCRVVMPCSTWASFHKWDVNEEEKKGIVLYLRSLEPTPQGSISIGRPPGGGGG
jgi:hypothetical protein